MNYELLVGSGAFWRRAAEDIAAAKRRILVQAMTFEGDATGRMVADAIAAGAATDRRVLVDDYTRHVINDRFIRSPFADAATRAEAVATTAMFDGLVAGGVGVRVTNPIGGNPLRYPTRNHKKLIVADDIAYIGGINFSDHNFAWHDMMVRIEGAACAAFLAEDFDATWNSRARYVSRTIGDMSVAGLDGRDNAEAFAWLLGIIATAKDRIDVVSAYPTFPFVDALGAAVGRGVKVKLYTPLDNNKPIIREYLMDAAARFGIEIGLLPEMTHLKAMLIDGGTFVFGSTNFDFVSFHAEEEFLVIARDPALIEAFKAKILLPAAASALPAGAYRPRLLTRLQARAGLALADVAVKALRGNRRSATDWRRMFPATTAEPASRAPDMIPAAVALPTATPDAL